jgi:WD40 repeat protein
VKTVLDQVAAGRLVLEGTGQGHVRGDGAALAERAIEAPYLQVVLEQLWAEETDPKMLRLATLTRLGGAEAIVRRHLDDALDRLDARERLVAADALRYLVTPSGTKIALDAADLASFTGYQRTEVASVLERLTSAQARILHAVGDPSGKSNGTRYEIAHDVLGGAVLDWRSRFLQTQERERQIAANHERVRRLRRWTVGLAAAVLVIGGIAALMVILWHSARVQKQRANQEAAKALHALVDSVLAAVVTDPAAALVAARGAVDDQETPETLDALRAALIASHERTRMHVSARYAALTPDDRFAFVVPRNGAPQLRDLGTAERARTFGRRPAGGGALSVDGRWVVTVEGDGAPRVWTPDGTRSWPLRGARGVQAVSFSADGSFVVTTSAGRARVWRTATGRPVGRPVRQDEVLDAALSRRAGRLVTGSEDGKVRVWDGRSGKRLYTLATGAGVPRAVAISPDGRFVAAATSGGARIWDLSESPELSGPEICGASETSAVSFANNSRLLVTGRADGTADVCNVLGEAIVTLVGHRGAVATAAFDSGARRVITAGADGTVRTWAVGAIALPGPTSDAAFDQSGKHVATTFERIRVWDADSGRRLPLRKFGTRDAITSALHDSKKRALSPDGHLLATANGTSVELRDPRTNRHLLELSGPDLVVAVAFDRAGSKLLVARAVKGATLYDCSGCGAPSELRKRAAQVAVRCPPKSADCP